jgi:hypothetical protein
VVAVVPSVVEEVVVAVAPSVVEGVHQGGAVALQGVAVVVSEGEADSSYSSLLEQRTLHLSLLCPCILMLKLTELLKLLCDLILYCNKRLFTCCYNLHAHSLSFLNSSYMQIMGRVNSSKFLNPTLIHLSSLMVLDMANNFGSTFLCRV